MDPRLLDYYNRELAYLRELGAEFSRQHPKIAGRLGMSGIEVADPYVERLLEGFAFLSGRIHLKMDAEFPRFSQRLLELADSITEIKTVCACGRKATVNARIGEDGHIITKGDQVFLGGNDSYVAMCHKCWADKIRAQQK